MGTRGGFVAVRRRGRARRGLLVASVAAIAASCTPAPVVWQDDAPYGTTAQSTPPSPIAFPGTQPFDASLPDSGGVSEFARTQDLLREAGAQSMLRDILDALPDARRAVDAPPSGTAPNHEHAMTMTAGATTAMRTTMRAMASDLGDGDAPRDSARCGRSLRMLAVPGVGQVAVWWSRRSRHRVALVAAWRVGDASDSASTAASLSPSSASSSSSSTSASPSFTSSPSSASPTLSSASAASASAAPWRGPIAVDTLDQGPGDANAAERGASGCERPAPGIAADGRAYVHVAYALNAPEGPGVFYAHQMDPRSAFEPPQAIVYGEHLGTARVAARGDVVAVVYEDPNSPSRTQIGLALSRSSGHLFGERIAVSSAVSAARDPFVAVRGQALVVGWSELPSSDAEAPIFRTRRALLR